MDNALEMLINKGIKVDKIFSPEHGMYGVPDGQKIDDSFYGTVRIPVKSLYGKNLYPSQNEYDGLDALIFDIESVGLRFYTFIYTMFYCMKAAADQGKVFMVLDRPNPLGRYVFGKIILPELTSFVGDCFLPASYGFTNGELALYIKKKYKLNLDLRIIKCTGWNGEYFCHGNELWNIPSPALPTFNSLLAYAGFCFFEQTNLSEGRGTYKPFEYIGAPWVDSQGLVAYLRNKFPDLKVRERTFVPFDRKYKGELCFGAEFFPSLKDNFFVISHSILRYCFRSGKLVINENIDRLTADRQFRLSIENTEEFSFDLWEKEGMEFMHSNEDILLYGRDKK